MVASSLVGERDQLLVVATARVRHPRSTKYSSPRQERPSFTMYGDHEPKFWIRPDLHVGRMDVDPVVREAALLGDHERHGQEVAVVEVVGGTEDLTGHRRVDDPGQRGQRHRGDHVRRRRAARSPVPSADGHRDGSAVSTWTRTAEVSIRSPTAHVDHPLGAPLPHHPRSELRVLELVDEARDLLRSARDAARSPKSGPAPTPRSRATCP